MSEASQGHGWWQASDGKWYPPQTMPPDAPAHLGGTHVPIPGPVQSEAGEKPRWYENGWILAISLLFCFPVGLVLVWTNGRLSKSIKILLTAVVLMLVAVVGVNDASGGGGDSTDAAGVAGTAQSTTTARRATTSGPPTTERRTTTTARPTTAPPTTAPPTTPPPTTAPPTTAPTTTAPPTEPTLPLSQQQAVRSARSYLEFSGFSRQGLIDQLSSEYGDKFSVDDATAAVDSLDVDYNAQAVRSAQSYLEFSSFSCDGLIDQLSSEFGSQFTTDEATFAANEVGLC